MESYINDIYINGAMELELLANIGDFALFERVEGGRRKEKSFVIAWNPVFEKDEVSWDSGTYFDGTYHQALSNFAGRYE